MMATQEQASSRRPIVVVTTVADRAQAQAIARALVAGHLAACVQIHPIDSIYAWQGEIREERELRLLVKTIERNYAAVEAAIRQLHSYELPAVHAIAFAHVEGAYGHWITDNSNGRS